MWSPVRVLCRTPFTSDRYEEVTVSGPFNDRGVWSEVWQAYALSVCCADDSRAHRFSAGTCCRGYGGELYAMECADAAAACGSWQLPRTDWFGHCMAGLWNTVLFTLLFVPTVMVISLLMAVMVNQKLRGIAFFRALFFMPYITAMVAVAMVWNWIFATRFGILNYVLATFFYIGDPPAWLADRAWALPALAIVAIWKQVGFQMLIFLAGLQGIPTALYEAASIDGANARAKFFRITLPLLSPVTFFVLVITTIDAFNI